MENSNQPCPNCGGVMVRHRHEQQQVGRRTIELLWVRCDSCTHVRLDGWRFVDGTEAEEGS